MLAKDAANRKLPDVMQMDYSRLGGYAKQNILLPLDSYVTSGEINLADVNKQHMETMIYDGKLYGMSLGSNANTMIYNPTIFEQTGVAPPSPRYKHTRISPESLAN